MGKFLLDKLKFSTHSRTPLDIEFMWRIAAPSKERLANKPAEVDEIIIVTPLRRHNPQKVYLDEPQQGKHPT
jgi:hypothetical protein